MWRIFICLFLLTSTIAAAVFAAQDESPDRPKVVRRAVDAEQERDALAFVRLHHKELADLLGPLRVMDRDEYDAAIRELSRARENIQRIERRDPDRGALALASWKAKSRVELLTARLISKPDPRLESELRLALVDQLAAQLAMQKYDREQLRKRLAQLDESIRRQERRSDTLVESRLHAVLKKVQRLRRQAEGGDRAESPSLPARSPGDES